MPDITYPYLPEGTTFNAASLNDRFAPTVGGINGVMEDGLQRGALSDQHLTKGLLANEKVPTYHKAVVGNTNHTSAYLKWGGNGTYNPVQSDTDRSVITCGAGPNNELKIAFSAGLQLGMGQADKVTGLLVLMNVYFNKAYEDSGQSDNYSPLMGVMTCIQGGYGSGPAHWLTFKKTERFQWLRTIAGETGAAPDLTGGGSADSDDVLVMQDISTRALILPADLAGSTSSSLYGIRGAASVWYPVVDPPNPPAHLSSTKAILYSASLTVIPLHAGV